MAYTKATKYGLVPKEKTAVTAAVSVPQFDLTKINVVQLAQDLSQFIYQPQPRSLISKWWQSKKLPYDRERIDHIISYVEQVRDLNSRITHLQAELYLSPQVLQSLLEQKIELANAQFKLQIKEFDAQINRLEHETKVREQELTRLSIENAILDSKKVQEQAKALFIQKALAAVKLDTMSQGMQTFITQTILAPNMAGYTPMEIIDELNKLVVKEKETAIRTAKAQAKKEEIQAELERLNVEEQYKKEGREPPGFK